MQINKDNSRKKWFSQEINMLLCWSIPAVARAGLSKELTQELSPK